MSCNYNDKLTQQRCLSKLFIHEMNGINGTYRRVLNSHLDMDDRPWFCCLTIEGTLEGLSRSRLIIKTEAS